MGFKRRQSDMQRKKKKLKHAKNQKPKKTKNLKGNLKKYLEDPNFLIGNDQ